MLTYCGFNLPFSNDFERLPRLYENHVSSFLKCLSKFFAHLKNWIVCFVVIHNGPKL